MALLFCQKFANCFAALFLAKSDQFMSGSFLYKNARLHPYFLPKICKFFCSIISGKKCPIYVRLFFWQKCKITALLFCHSFSKFVGECIWQKKGATFCPAFLWEKCKTIALPFAQNLQTVLQHYFWQKVSNLCPALFWVKMHGYGLTFLPKISQSCWRMYLAKNVEFMSGSFLDQNARL